MSNRDTSAILFGLFCFFVTFQTDWNEYNCDLFDMGYCNDYRMHMPLENRFLYGVEVHSLSWAGF